MQTSNGQPLGRELHPVPAAPDARHASPPGVSCTPVQADFLAFLRFHGPTELAASLRKVHDWALYHSSVPIEEPEKNALLEVKLLWEGLEGLH